MWLFALGWTCLAAVVIAQGLATSPRSADLALVLGNSVDRHDRPLPRLAARLDAARALYVRGGCGHIMVSGGIDRDGRNEAKGMKRWLVEHGVPANAIVVDPQGDNTRASAAHARAWLDAHGGRSVVVVSQYFHLPRARLAVRQAGLVDAGGDYPRRWFGRDVYSVYREVPGLFIYWLQLDQSRPLAPIRAAGR